jgi:hypothetical protein
VINVSLSREAIGLEGITVTALGITREKRSLGYSVQNVSGEQIADVPKLNLVDAMQGHVAGVKITSTNTPGGSSRIVIRGASSITGNNQPLFIVDGMPIDNTARSNAGGSNATGGGYDYGNNAADLDPEPDRVHQRAEGPERGGAVRVAGGERRGSDHHEARPHGRRPGHHGHGRHHVRHASQAPRLPEPVRPGLRRRVLVDGRELQRRERRCRRELGPEAGWPADLPVHQPGRRHGQLQPTPWVPQPNNVRDFFDTGVTTQPDVSLARSDERSNVRLSATSMQMSGMYPSNRIERLSATLAGGDQADGSAERRGHINYMQNEARNRPGTGYSGNNVMQQFVWFGRQVDINVLRNNYACAPNDTRGPCAAGPRRGTTGTTRTMTTRSPSRARTRTVT